MGMILHKYSQRTELSSSKASKRIGWLIVLVVILAWCCLLFFQRGHPYDEAEHAHVGWMISQGKLPITDFFQHHQPLLWSVLALYYRAGFTGAGVLIWGRMLVVLCGLVSFWALWRLGGYGKNPRPTICMLGAALFIGITGFIPELFVIRPETISAATFLLGLAIWYEKETIPFALLAGILAGIAMYSSPRFVLLGGFFILLGKNTVKRWLALSAGALVFLVSYTLASGFGVEKILFSLRFSSYLQSVGTGGGRRESTWLGLLLITCLPVMVLLRNIRPSDRVKGMALVGYAILVFIASHHFAGLFRYAQAYSAFVVAVSIAAAWVASRLESAAELRWALPAVLTAMLALPLAGSFRPGHARFDFLSSVRARNRLAALVPAGGTVLVFTKDNPITIPDASYYGIPLSDAKNRLCQAVITFHSNIKLPECDFLKTLRVSRPYLIDANISLATSDEAEAQRIVHEDYQMLKLDSSYPMFFQQSIEQRTKAGSAQVGQ
jgi:hypothetical protein